MGDRQFHPEGLHQGREARLFGFPKSYNWHPPGFFHDSWDAGWEEVDKDPNAPKEEIKTQYLKIEDLS